MELTQSIPQIVRDLTIMDLCGELDLCEETIRRHMRVGAPSEKRGKQRFYNIDEYRTWMASQNLTGEAVRPRPAEGDSPDLDKANLRKANALAAKYELQVRREKRDLLSADEVKGFFTHAVSSLRSKLLNAGATVSPILEGRDGAERQQIIDEYINRAMNEFADSLEVSCGDQAAQAA